MVIYVPVSYGGVGAGVPIGSTPPPAAHILPETDSIGPFDRAMEWGVARTIVKA